MAALGGIASSPHPVADAIRVLSFVLGAATLPVVLIVTAAYFAAYRRHRAAVAAGAEQRAWRGLLPMHVTLVGFAYALLVVATMVETVQRLHEPISAFGATYVVSYAAALWSLWAVLGYERRQVRDLRRRHPRIRSKRR